MASGIFKAPWVKNLARVPMALPHWHHLKLQSPEGLLACHPSQCTAHCGSNIFFQILTSISNQLQVIFCPRSIFCWLSWYGALLAVRHFLLSILHCFFFFLLIIASKLQAMYGLAGSHLDLRKSSNYPLVSFKKSCTKDLESCTLNFLSKTMCSETLYLLASVLSQYVDVFQWDHERFILWVPKLHTRFFMVSIH